MFLQIQVHFYKPIEIKGICALILFNPYLMRSEFVTTKSELKAIAAAA